VGKESRTMRVSARLAGSSKTVTRLTNLMILMSIQLFDDVVRSWKSGGANER
jgi:hypothetical protein